MAELSALYIYPVKSLRGIARESAALSDRGLEHDRRFMVVDDGGHMLTQRVLGTMARITTAIVHAELTLTFEGTTLSVPLAPTAGTPRTVRVFADQVDALDVGDAARRFLSDALGRSASLVYMPDATRRRVDPKRAAEHDIVSFADGFPYLLTNESSLDALNRELAEPVTMQRFRPNLVVRGLPAYAEDQTGPLRIGAIPFLALKPSSRCVIVNTDPTSGERAKGVFEALLRSHAIEKRPMFGQNLVARGSGQVTVGDPVAFG